MARPRIIGISSYARAGKPQAFSLPCSYVDAVRAAGGMPVLLPPGETEPDGLLDIVDGLILAGGGDIAPARYGGEPHETIYSVCEERDHFEFALTRAALARPDLPLLCICRGMQVLNVVCGGSLHVHVPEQFGDAVPHRQPPRMSTTHPVRLEPRSRLARMLGATDIEVCSWHHQAIDAVGADLTPIAWAEDGVIEAVELAAHPWCFGVQWHPEMQPDSAAAQRLFAQFVGHNGAPKGKGKKPTA